MDNISAPVTSSQYAPHKNLQRKVQQYLNTGFLNSIPKYAQDEFYRFSAATGNKHANIILDSGCGIGESTVKLAAAYPECLVVGVDKSASRILRCKRRNAFLNNIIFVRCDLIHFWRLLQQSGYKLSEHYLLYPNPWPKPGHLQRRWHAHPVFSAVVQLGGKLTMRTNWCVYAQEFVIALRIYTEAKVSVSPLRIDAAMTAFERKYAASGHQLYEVTINLPCD